MGNYIASKLSYDDDRREIIIRDLRSDAQPSILIIILLLALITGLLKRNCHCNACICTFTGLRVTKPVLRMVSSVIFFLTGFSAVVMLDYLFYLAFSGDMQFSALPVLHCWL